MRVLSGRGQVAVGARRSEGQATTRVSLGVNRGWTGSNTGWDRQGVCHAQMLTGRDASAQTGRQGLSARSKGGVLTGMKRGRRSRWGKQIRTEEARTMRGSHWV